MSNITFYCYFCVSRNKTKKLFPKFLKKYLFENDDHDEFDDFKDHRAIEIMEIDVFFFAKSILTYSNGNVDDFFDDIHFS